MPNTAIQRTKRMKFQTGAMMSIMRSIGGTKYTTHVTADNEATTTA